MTAFTYECWGIVSKEGELVVEGGRVCFEGAALFLSPDVDAGERLARVRVTVEVIAE